MPNIIECRNLWKIYNQGTRAEVRALRGVNLHVRKGELLGIFGSSGSGKSTLMSIMGTLDTPTRGKVIIDGIDVSEMNENERAKLRREKIGFVFQTFNLIGDLTALENVEIPMIFAGVGSGKRRERAEKLLESVGLGERLDHRPGELSGGERQRVAIARALANDPEVILADEPTGNLDSKTGKEIINLFAKLHKDGRTIVIVTHDPKMREFVKRYVTLKDGKIEG